MTDFVFPQPGERHNTSAILVSEEVLVNLLCLAVQGALDQGCPDPECPDCRNNRLSCQVGFSLLSPYGRALTDAFLVREAHINPGDWRR